ncbi:hypothetical protein LX36DRAFT_347678 [Colletotrichum falcatum]|nr:hypothetical protein LX36DRAFT_347678 [Colletotrichum falcatum]
MDAMDPSHLDFTLGGHTPPTTTRGSYAKLDIAFLLCGHLVFGERGKRKRKKKKEKEKKREVRTRSVRAPLAQFPYLPTYLGIPRLRIRAYCLPYTLGFPSHTKLPMSRHSVFSTYLARQICPRQLATPHIICTYIPT